MCKMTLNESRLPAVSNCEAVELAIITAELVLFLDTDQYRKLRVYHTQRATQQPHLYKWHPAKSSKDLKGGVL